MLCALLWSIAGTFSALAEADTPPAMRSNEESRAVAPEEEGQTISKKECLLFVNGVIREETDFRELAAADAYLNRSPEVARWVLEDLIAAYGRLGKYPSSNPDENTQRFRDGAILAHARLARIYERLEQPGKAQEHLDEALQGSSIADEEALWSRVEMYDQAQKARLREYPWITKR
jgi:hypothetical protein